jgi:hypothetical protein
MSEINAQKNATETEAKNFYEWLESNKAGFDKFMSSVFTDSPFPQGIADDAVTKFKIVNRALKYTIYKGHALMFSAAILWEKVKPTLTPEQIEQFKKADLSMVRGSDIFDKIAAVAGKDEAKRQMQTAIDQAEERRAHFAGEAEQHEAVPECPASDPKDYSV